MSNAVSFNVNLPHTTHRQPELWKRLERPLPLPAAASDSPQGSGTGWRSQSATAVELERHAGGGPGGFRRADRHCSGSTE